MHSGMQQDELNQLLFVLRNIRKIYEEHFRALNVNAIFVQHFKVTSIVDSKLHH